MQRLCIDTCICTQTCGLDDVQGVEHVVRVCCVYTCVLCVYMCVVCIHVCLSVNVCVWILHTCVCVRVYMYIWIVHTHTCVCVYIEICNICLMPLANAHDM